MTAGTGNRVHVEKSGVVAMALSVEEAFPLFNADGEQRWAAGWNPRFPRPAEPKVGEGVVFQAVQQEIGTATWRVPAWRRVSRAVRRGAATGLH